MAKVTEYPLITKMKANDILLVDGPDGTRTILKNNAAKDLGGDIIAVTKSGSKDKITLNLTDSPVDLATEKDLDGVANDLLPIGTASGKPAIVTDAKLGTTFKRLKVAIEPVQAGSGDPAPDNVRPISGWNTVKVTRCGKNILDPSRIVTQTGWFTIYIDVQEGHMVTASTDLPTGTGLLSYFMITAQGGEEALYATHPVTKPSNPNLHLALRHSSGDDVFSNYHYQVEIGSAATEYEPYVGNVSEVELPSEAGTVYGGVLDLMAGTLTVDRANIASYNGESLPGKWISSMDVYSAGATPTTGAQVVYELSSSIVYNLTPEQIEALEGYNAVFADCGSVELAYVKDVKIEEMIAEESDSTASRAFTAGEYVIIKDKLYKVTTDVSSGTALVPGTNIEETTVGEELNEIGEEAREEVGELKTQFINLFEVHGWRKGLFSADGTVASNGNGAVSPSIAYPISNVIELSDASCVLAFYDLNNTYLGKVASDGTINKTDGSWKYFTGTIDATQYAPSNASYVLICALPSDGSTVTDENVSEWVQNHVSVKTKTSKQVEELEAKTNVLKTQIYQSTDMSGWQKGLFAADGTVSSGNGAVSPSSLYVVSSSIEILQNARAVLAFYDEDNRYLGKVAADGTIDKIAGSWKFFTGIVDAEQYAPINAKYVLIGALPTDGTTITEEALTEWVTSHVSIVNSVIEELKKDIEHNDNRLSNVENIVMYPLVDNKVEWIDGEYIIASGDHAGEVGTSATYHRTDWIELNSDYKIILTCTNASYYDSYYNAWYDENKEFISNFSYVKNGTIILDPPINAKYCRLSCNKTVVLITNAIRKSITNYIDNKVNLEDTQTKEEFDNSLDAYDLFTGWKRGYYANANGLYEENHDNYVCTKEPIELNADTDILYFANSQDFPNSTFYIAIYDEEMNYIKSTMLNDPNTRRMFGIANDEDLLGKKLYIHLSFNRGGVVLNPDEVNKLIVYRNTCGKYRKITDNSMGAFGVFNLEFTNKVFYRQSVNQFRYNGAIIGTKKTLKFDRPVKITAKSGYSVGVFKFSDSIPSYSSCIYDSGWVSEYVVNPNTYFIINLKYTAGGYIFPENADGITIQPVYDSDGYYNTTYVKGTLDATGMITTSGNGAVTDLIPMPYYVKLSTGTRAVLALHNENEYLGKINANNELDKVAGSWKYFTGSIDVKSYLNRFNATMAKLCILPPSGTTIADNEEAQTFGKENVEIYNIKYTSYEYLDKNYVKKSGSGDTTVNYYLNEGFKKLGISLTNLGTLTYPQSFCKYNDKYYSIDGSNIAVQDSDFVKISDTPLNTGHGNSLQVGENGLAYASGWNDNKIYVVDLENLTIDSVIDLPTQGYTTGVVDETRNLAYIFQRESYPATDDYYNFITYDIANETIISTRKVSVPFTAMQACDLYHDRIIVLNGLGSNNGYRIFDLNGNIIGEYIIGSILSEPEGVCVDRDTHELLISYVSKLLYKIS